MQSEFAKRHRFWMRLPGQLVGGHAFQYPTGGAGAIDTALKILNGETVPKEIVLGTRLFDKNNVAQGGQELN